MKQMSAASRPWASGSIAIDQLVHWALVDQRAGDIYAGLFGIEAQAMLGDAARQISGDGCAAVERIGKLGCQVDGGGHVLDCTDPVAEVVAVLIMQLPDDQRALVQDHGRTGEAPGGWKPPARWLAPMRWEKPEAEACTAYVRAKQGWHCPLVRMSSVETMGENRRLYTRWWDGLEVLGFNLSLRPLPFVVRAPSVPREPWAAGA